MANSGFTRNGKNIKIDFIAFAKTMPNPGDPNELINDSITYLFRLQVTNSSYASHADTVQVTVVDEPLDINTVTFHNLVWEIGGIYGLAEIDNFLNTSLRLVLFDINYKVKPLKVC